MGASNGKESAGASSAGAPAAPPPRAAVADTPASTQRLAQPGEAALARMREGMERQAAAGKSGGGGSGLSISPSFGAAPLEEMAAFVVPKDQLSYPSSGGGVQVPKSSGASPPPEGAGADDDAAVNRHVNSETGQPDIFRGGRYKIATPETMDYWKQQQPSNPNLVAKTRSNEMQDLRKHLEETEGLKIGSRRMTDLAQQWRFFLACEPVQRGMDCGLLAGSFFAVGRAMNPAHRAPMKVLWNWMIGFSFGMVALPSALIAYEQYNLQRIMRTEQEMFQQQRSEYYDELKKR